MSVILPGQTGKGYQLGKGYQFYALLAAEVFYTHFSFCQGIEKDVYSMV